MYRASGRLARLPASQARTMSCRVYVVEGNGVRAHSTWVCALIPLACSASPNCDILRSGQPLCADPDRHMLGVRDTDLRRVWGGCRMAGACADIAPNLICDKNGRFPVTPVQIIASERLSTSGLAARSPGRARRDGEPRRRSSGRAPCYRYGRTTKVCRRAPG